jgi:hypothetical protein
MEDDMHYGPDGDFPYEPGYLVAEPISDSVAALTNGVRTLSTFAHTRPGAALKLARGMEELPAMLGAIHRLSEGDGNAADDLFRSFAKIVGVPVQSAGLTPEERGYLAHVSGNPAWFVDVGQFETVK